MQRGRTDVERADDHEHDLARLARLTPRPDVRLVVTDLDGTLLNENRAVPVEFWDLADELIARGITVAPASGRYVHSLREKFAPILDDVVLIASNGAHVVVRDRTYLADGLSRQTAADVVRRLRDVEQASAVLCGLRSAYVEERDPAFIDWISPHYPVLVAVDDLTTVDDDVLSVGVFDAVGAERNALPALAPFEPVVRFMATDPHWVDVVSPTADKGSAVRALQERLGVTPDQTMVFGDYLNDLGMMATASLAVAMANAHPSVRERAPWRAPANNANGVVRAVRAVLGLDVPR